MGPSLLLGSRLDSTLVLAVGGVEGSLLAHLDLHNSESKKNPEKLRAIPRPQLQESGSRSLHVSLPKPSPTS